MRWSCLASNGAGVLRHGSSHGLSNATEVLFYLGMMLTNTAPTIDGFDTRVCSNHLFPQSAGYGFAPTEGVRRLHFVGRMHELDGDWEALLTQLASRGKGGEGPAAPNASRPSSRVQHVNRRRQPSIGANEREELRQHPVVAKHLAWDFRCFPGCTAETALSRVF